MAAIQRSPNDVGFIVRWSKLESEKFDHGLDDEESDIVDHKTNLIEKNVQHKEMAAVLGVAVPLLKESNRSNQVLENADETKGIIQLPTPSCTQKQEDTGSCQLIDSTSSMLCQTYRFRSFPPLLHSRQRTTKRPVQHVAPMSKANPSESDDRECMAQALQSSIKSLVDGLLFSESELPDYLTSGGCLTDEESYRIRNSPCRKGQIRFLVCLIKGRDFNVMKKFIKYVSQQSPNLAESIQVKFENNKRNGVGATICTFCKLVNHVDVKDVIDSLWEYQLIMDDLYTTICHSDAPVGAQRELWINLVHSLQELSSKNILLANEQIVNALRTKGVFTYLEEKVNISNMICSCKFKSMRQRCTSISSSEDESCYPDSSSDSTLLVEDNISD